MFSLLSFSLIPPRVMYPPCVDHMPALITYHDPCQQHVTDRGEDPKHLGCPGWHSRPRLWLWLASCITNTMSDPVHVRDTTASWGLDSCMGWGVYCPLLTLGSEVALDAVSVSHTSNLQWHSTDILITIDYPAQSQRWLSKILLLFL